MPRAPKLCTTKGCTSGATPGHSKCETHRLEARRTSDARRPNARQRGYDKTWERTRASYLAAHPYCECGCGKRSTDVDHIDGLGPNGPLGHDPSNLQALAHGCHSRLTAQHNGAFGRPATPRGTTAA